MCGADIYGVTMSGSLTAFCADNEESGFDAGFFISSGNARCIPLPLVSIPPPPLLGGGDSELVWSSGTALNMPCSGNGS